MARYAVAVDDGTEDDMLSLFTDDVVIEGPLSGTHSGRDGVSAWIRSVPDRPKGQDRHILSVFEVERSTVGARADVHFLHLRTTGLEGNRRTELFCAGRFECEFKRVGKRWLICRRKAILDASPMTSET